MLHVEDGRHTRHANTFNAEQEFKLVGDGIADGDDPRAY
jgi:hypothetical protein